MGTCRGRFWRTTQRAAGENKTQQENETPAIPAHPQGPTAIRWESPRAPLTAPAGSQKSDTTTQALCPVGTS